MDFHFVPPADKKRTTPVLESVNVSQIDSLMTDTEAEAALYDCTDVTKPPEEEQPKDDKSAKRGKPVKTGRVEVINVDVLNNNFQSGDYVNLKVLKERKLVPKNTVHVKILARGTLSKQLTVCAYQFSFGAIKMITLVGGNAVKTLED